MSNNWQTIYDIGKYSYIKITDNSWDKKLIK